MSAEYEIGIFIDKVKIFFNAKQERLKKNIQEVRRNIEALDKIKESNGEYKNHIIAKMKKQIEELETIGREEDVKGFQNFLKQMEDSNDTEIIKKIWDKAFDRFYDILDEEDEKMKEASDKELRIKYISERLREMGQSVEILEDGSIRSKAKDPEKERDIFVNFDNENVVMDIPGKAKKCISTMWEFEKLIENEGEKIKTSWHTVENEKELEKKKKMKKRIENFNIGNIYNEELLTKTK